MLIILMGAIAFVTAGGAISFGLWRRGRAERQAYLNEARRDAIGYLPGGTVARVQGEVVLLRDVLSSPLTGRPCVSYAVLVRLDSYFGPIIVKAQAGVRFAVHDPSGRALIEMDGVNITLTADREQLVSLRRSLSPAQEAILVRGAKLPDLLRHRTRNLVFIEAVLLPGTVIDVLGTAAREPDPESARESGYRDGASTRVAFHSTATPDPEEGGNGRDGSGA